MTRSIVRATALAAALILILAACGGAAAPNTSEPAGTVNAALDAAKNGGFAKLADYTCAAKKGDLTSLFGGGGASGLGALGISADELFAAMKIDFQDVKTTETSKTGTNATVHITGKTVMTFDQAKMKEVFKKMLSAQGQPADDATLSAMMTAMSSQLTQTTALDEDIPMVQEGGKWLICA